MADLYHLYRVVAPHFCAGFIVYGALVIKAAPVLAYMTGWTLKRSLEYCQKKGWELTIADSWAEPGHIKHANALRRIELRLDS